MQRDLWGKPKREKADKWERGLKHYDAVSFPDRLRRLRIVASAETSPIGYILSYPNTKFLFDDAKNCFIFGQFAACILVCQSLLEHHLKEMYRMSGNDNVIRLGFKRLIQRALADRVLPEFLAQKLDDLRKRRNPLVHTEPDALGSHIRKAVELNITSEELLEQEATDAFMLTFEILNRCPFP
jgi:hypothetical protein